MSRRGTILVTLVAAILITSGLLSGCTPPKKHYSTASRGTRLTGFGPIPFGTPYLEAANAITHSGTAIVARKPDTLWYHTEFEGYPFLVAQSFGPDGRAGKAILSLFGEERIHPQSQCESIYHHFRKRLDARYGHTDANPPDHNVETACNVIARYSFADSSFIDLYFTYNPGPDNQREKHGCTITVSYNPPYANLCLVTNNRFCEINSLYFIPQTSLDSMAAPWK